MAKINLLPWREKLREARKKKFLAMLGVSAVLGIILVFCGSVYIDSQIEAQGARNEFIQMEIRRLNESIAETEELKKRKAVILERMNVIYSLQGNRPVIVKVFDELVRVTPEGVYFTFLDMRGTRMVIKGVAKSNNRISALMRHFDESDWFDKPNLTAVQALNDGLGNSFDLTVQQVTPPRKNAS